MKVFNVTIKINSGMHEFTREFERPLETSLNTHEALRGALERVLDYLQGQHVPHGESGAELAPEPADAAPEAAGQDFGWTNQAEAGA